jgi:DNA-binding response OmpR family regulator
MPRQPCSGGIRSLEQQLDLLHSLSHSEHINEEEHDWLDHGLPGAEGCIVLERLKSIMLLSTISVIVVTAQDPDVAE